MRQVTRYSRFRQVRARGPVPLAGNEKRPDQRSGRFRDETEPGGRLFSRGFSPTPAEQAIASATSNPVGLATNIRD
jgi:hypothetical protein